MSGQWQAAQLPLALRFPDAARLENFVERGNEEALAILAGLTPGAGPRAVYLWGEGGVGKTHLLQAMCAAADAGAAACLPLAALVRDFPPSVLEGLETRALLCLDDVPAVAGRADWEQALFVLYNRARDAGAHLLFTGRQAPAALSIELPDLRSRLLWDLVLHLKPLDDTGRGQALQRRARWRGLELPDDVAWFLLHRCSRSLQDLMYLLEHLDTASLASGRRLTIPFVKQALGL